MSARPKIEAYKLRKHLHDDLPRGHGPVKPGSVLAAVIVFSCFAFLAGYAVKGLWP